MRRMNGVPQPLPQPVMAVSLPEDMRCAVSGCREAVEVVARVGFVRITFCCGHRARVREYAGQPCGPLKHLQDEIRRLSAEDLNSMKDAK